MITCPSHRLPLDRRHSVADAFLCRECESMLLAARASRPSPIPDIPENLTPDEAMRLLVEALSDPTRW
jgi:hypothetical protein